MYGYPETIALRHLTKHPSGASAPSPFALLALVAALLVIAGLGFVYTSLQTSDATPQAHTCPTKTFHKGGGNCR